MVRDWSSLEKEPVRWRWDLAQPVNPKKIWTACHGNLPAYSSGVVWKYWGTGVAVSLCSRYAALPRLMAHNTPTPWRNIMKAEKIDQDARWFDPWWICNDRNKRGVEKKED